MTDIIEEVVTRHTSLFTKTALVTGSVLHAVDTDLDLANSYASRTVEADANAQVPLPGPGAELVTKSEAISRSCLQAGLRE